MSFIDYMLHAWPGGAAQASACPELLGHGWAHIKYKARGQDMGSGERVLVAMDLGLLLGDVVALTEAVQSKGHNGVKCCVCCRNVVHAKSTIGKDCTEEQLKALNLLKHTSCEVEAFELQTDRGLQEYFVRLQESAPNAALLKRVEKDLGMKYNPHGWLTDTHLKCRLIDNLCWDWFHIYLINGVFTREVHLSWVFW